jgi:hypothetical protein
MDSDALFAQAVEAARVDDYVQWSIVRALGATNDFRAVPVLVGFAGHSDADVRCAVTIALPSAMGEVLDDTGVEALIALSRDAEIANTLIFEAAAFLADESLLPLLEKFDSSDPDVAVALRECDPSERDNFAFQTFDALQELLPGKNISLYGERFELGLTLELTENGRATAWWSIEGLQRRAVGDPELAACLTASDVVRGVTE